MLWHKIMNFIKLYYNLTISYFLFNNLFNFVSIYTMKSLFLLFIHCCTGCLFPVMSINLFMASLKNTNKCKYIFNSNTKIISMHIYFIYKYLFVSVALDMFINFLSLLHISFFLNFQSISWFRNTYNYKMYLTNSWL